MKKKSASFFTILLRSVALAFYGRWQLLWGGQAVGVLHGLSWAVGVWSLQSAFDSVVGAVSGASSHPRAYAMLLLYGALTIFQQVLNGVHNFLSTKYFRTMLPWMTRRLSEKAARIEPIMYESPECLDAINKAEKGSEGSLDLMFTVINIPVFYLPYFAFLAAYLYRQEPVLVLALPLVFVPVLITQFIRSAVFARLEDEAAPLRRRYEYFEKTLVDREFFKETRSLGAFGYLRGKYVEARAALNRKTWRAERKTFLWNLAMSLITLIGYLGVLLLLFDSLMNGNISVGVFAAVYANIGMMFGMMEEVICTHIGNLAREMGTVKNYFAFMDLPERPGESGALPANGGVALEGVRFRYPGAERDAVAGVSLSVAPGETIAIVGENGAGKTTLVRLIMGLYLPQSGRVRRGGVDAASRKMGFQGVSAVFQKFQRYRMTLNDNVTISSEAEKSGALAQALAKAEIAMPPETMLAREFGGVDLSGGQWQRVAIARGLYRSNDMIVLDEPTAAIDPLEETRVYKKFAELSEKATAFIVTHRMGSARIADRILVMADGKIDDIGTHEELMAREGLYARMVRAQAEWYIA